MRAKKLNALSLIFLTGVASAAMARAPGDGDAFCSLHSTFVKHSVSNIKVLMDSFNYFNLLPPHEGAVWQQLDLDDNNVPGEGTEWSQNSNQVCRQAVTVCGFERGIQNNWLITQYISRTVNGTLLPQVSVQVEFELTGNSTFALKEYTTSTENSTSARDTRNYQLVQSVTTEDDIGENRQNQTNEINFESDESGFYVALVDKSTCVAVTRIIVFYNVCPEENKELVVHPETIAPIVERISTPFEVTAECVAGASPDNGDAVRLNCNQGGTWTTIPGSGCSCNPGFNTSDDGRSCLARCVSSQYYSVLNEECRDCPENSESMESGLIECPCVEGYYRAVKERDFPCTQPPSKPRNLVISAMTVTLFLTWDPPLNLGGRTDTSYSIWYQEEGKNTRVDAVITTTTFLVITGLHPGILYTVFVSAENGVSELAGSSNSNFLEGFVTTLKEDSQVILITATSASLLLLLVIVSVAVLVAVFIKRRARGANPVQSDLPLPLPPQLTSQGTTLNDDIDYSYPIVRLGDNALYGQSPNNIPLIDNVAYAYT